MIEWIKNEGTTSSKDNRFSIIKATDKIHSGDWEIHDDQTKQIHYGYTLKHAKEISEGLLKT